LQEKFFNLPEEEHGQKLLADFQANAVRSQRSTHSALSSVIATVFELLLTFFLLLSVF